MALNLLTIAQGTTKASGTEWFTDLTITENLKVHISLAVATAMTLEVTKDGTNYANGATFSANDAKELTIYLKAGSVFNLRQSSGSTVTITYCDIIAERI